MLPDGAATRGGLRWPSYWASAWWKAAESHRSRGICQNEIMTTSENIKRAAQFRLATTFFCFFYFNLLAYCHLE